jgi:hypothetical protein
MNSHFYVALPSDSSEKYYPDNTVARFVTRLSETVRLDGEYEMALAEIIYPHNWFNVDNKDGITGSLPRDLNRPIFERFTFRPDITKMDPHVPPRWTSLWTSCSVRWTIATSGSFITKRSVDCLCRFSRLAGTF